MKHKTDWSAVNDLVKEFDEYIEQKYRTYSDIEIYSFPQIWGSTALGYGGIGGQAITTAQTIVLYETHQNIVRVYFGGGRLAYEVKNPSQVLFEDLSKWQMKEVSRADVYRRNNTDIYGNILE